MSPTADRGQARTDARRRRAGPESFRGLADAAFPLGDDLELLYSPPTLAAQVFDAGSGRLAQECHTFAPLDEHARRLCAELRLPPGPAGAVRDQLAALAEAGVLVSYPRALDLLRGGPEGEAPPRVGVVGVPTRNRPACLERCLRALVASCREHGRTPEVVVVDDSTDPTAAQANRGVLDSLRPAYDGVMVYAGRVERAALADRLARRAGLDRADVRFALLGDPVFPVAIGAARNTLLLLAAGKLLLQLDDDTVPSPAPLPGAGSGLAASSLFDPTEFWFPGDGPVPQAAGTADLLAVHERLLGWPLADCLAGEPDLDRAGPGFYRRAAGGAGRVRVTAAGVAGDSGMSAPLYLLTLEGPARKRLLGSESGYRAALASRRVVRAATQPTVCDGAVCMGLNLGLDLRRPLPPFLPVQRNEDGGFGALVTACCPDAFFGFLPWLVPHEPPGGRTGAPEDLLCGAVGVHTSHVVQLLLQAHAPRGLSAAGAALAELAALPAAGFSEAVRVPALAAAAGLASHLADLLRRYRGRPGYWAADVRRVLKVMRRRVAEPDYIVPEDLARAFGPERAIDALRDLTGRFGRLLQIWPAVWQAAKN
jgi:hypothetical protein